MLRLSLVLTTFAFCRPSRLHLATQVLADGLVLCSAGAMAGLGLAYAGMKTLPALIRLDLPSWQRLEMDASTPPFGLGLALATALFAGAGPAWRLARTARAEGLRPGVRASAGPRQRRLGRMQVAVQAALAFVLLAVTSTLILGRRSANLLWPGDRVVGKRMRSAQDPDQPWREVVGVVGDVRRQLASSAWQDAAAIYLPAAQNHPANVHFVLRVRDGFAAEALRR